ncbi:MAG: hypothetical protein QM770_19445 [Tepidisphaeraceae bacterium]
MRKPAPIGLATASFVLTAISAGVGVLIFLTFVVTRNADLPVAGFFWLFIGGVLTFIASICGVTYAAMALASRWQGPNVKRRAALAVLLPLATVVLAWVLAVVGTELMKQFESQLLHAD